MCRISLESSLPSSNRKLLKKKLKSVSLFFLITRKNLGQERYFILLTLRVRLMQHRTHYHLITFYKFVDIPTPLKQVREHLTFCHDIGMKGRIYIGEEGISATASCNDGQLAAYRAFLKQSPYFNDVDDQLEKKTSKVKHHMFDKLIVRYREEIVALGTPITQASFEKSVQRLSDEGLKQVIDSDNDDRVILDMRNSYEYKLGHFKNAIPA